MRLILSSCPTASLEKSVLVMLLVVGLLCEHWILNALGIYGFGQVGFLVLLGLFLFFALPHRAKQFAELVEDCGNSLHIAYADKKFNVLLDEIRSVQIVPAPRSTYLVRLILKKVKGRPSSVRFYGALPSEHPAIRMDLENLKDRVEKSHERVT
ncbi:MAG: hypothetical protein QM808_04040 [Steroidobacteraceae bacterium]